MNSDNDNSQDSGDAPAIFIIIGQVSQEKGGDMAPVHVMLAAPDEDTAVRLCLDALSAKGYAEADLDQIGLMGGMPDEEPHASAYQGALEGEVAVVTFDQAANGR
ncbi:transcriptional regulator [Hoeflea sp. AS60]|uniref:transcriptional regulator n=1 Tax=Hoeflea sp. AS60 TaxID=3135780 RepID=UPI00317BEAFE